MCGERFFLFEENGKEPENSVSLRCFVNKTSDIIAKHKSALMGVVVFLLQSVVQAPAPVQRYLLNVTLKQGRNLVIRDKRSGRLPFSKCCKEFICLVNSLVLIF